MQVGTVTLNVSLERGSWAKVAELVKRMNEQGIETCVPDVVDKLVDVGLRAVLLELYGAPDTVATARELAGLVRGRTLKRRPRHGRRTA